MLSRRLSRARRIRTSHQLETLEPRALLSAVPYGADYRDNSEFMLGTVNVTVVLLESNGQVDASKENWTSTMIANVKREITAGLQWWEDTLAAKSSTHTLDFNIDFTYADAPVSTRYEPIARSSSDQTLWIDDFLTSVGSNTTASMFTDMRQFNHAQRQAKGTNWSYTVFVANSLADTDGKFTDGHSGYAYLGGPFVTLTYDNGGWGIDRMAEVFAHETAHIFYALDEYPGSNTYTSRSGYYNTQNLNAWDGNPNTATRVTSLMSDGGSMVTAYNSHTSSPTSLQMIGWKDSDGDGIFDVLDVPLTLSGSGAFDANAGGFRFMGSSAVGTLTNANPNGARHNLTINTVDALQYRLDGGQWTTAATYGGYSANINQLIAVSTPGNHTIDLRTIDTSLGVTSNIWSSTFAIAQPESEIITTPKGITVTPVSGLITTEGRTTASFSVVLDAAPTSDVTISVASSDASEGVASVQSLTFTASNWNVAQTVTVTGVDDATVDGDINYRVILGPAVSADSGYQGMDATDVALLNRDNDVAVTRGDVIITRNGTTTTEAGGVATFSVKLSKAPTSTVSLSLASMDKTEGSVSVSGLTFNSGNWNVAQTVTVKGIDDSLRDGNVSYRIALKAISSLDGSFNGVDPSDLVFTNTDNEPTTTTSKSGTKKNTVRSRAPGADLAAMAGYRPSASPSAANTVWARDLASSHAAASSFTLRQVDEDDED